MDNEDLIIDVSDDLYAALARQPAHCQGHIAVRLPLLGPAPPDHIGVSGAAAQLQGRLQPLAAPSGLSGPQDIATRDAEASVTAQGASQRLKALALSLLDEFAAQQPNGSDQGAGRKHHPCVEPHARRSEGS